MELNHIKHSTLLALTSAIQLNLIKGECVLLKLETQVRDSYPTILSSDVPTLVVLTFRLITPINSLIYELL